MDKAEIVEVLKSEGLDIAEDMAVDAVNAVFRLIEVLLPKVNPTLALVLSPMLAPLKTSLLNIIDQIDGKDDPSY